MSVGVESDCKVRMAVKVTQTVQCQCFIRNGREGDTLSPNE